ncbi:P-loop NTPase fold protein [Chryseobacterium wanjuense]
MVVAEFSRLGMSKEYIKNVLEKFDDHLNIDHNNRIIFSGRFGIGKSYFLNKFFEDESYKQKYFPIFLNPINYSIASNEDIFELLKFDILFQILSKDVIKFENLKFSKGNLLHQYFSNKFLEDFVSTTDLIGENIMEEQTSGSFGLLKNLGKLIGKISEVSVKDFENFKDQIQKNPELQAINEFLEQQQNKLGSFYENNTITQLIYDLIKNIENITTKKTVLIIDDLDRIDPEHIFRILNVFSAHVREEENKFGIEKVVLVCDLKNIKNIYHHFYGEHVDFFGYINKFYSIEPYEYSNKDYALKFKSEYYSEKYIDWENIRLLGFLFSDAIAKNFITARQLFNMDFSKKSVTDYYENFFRDRSIAVFEGARVSNFNEHRETYALLATTIYYFGSSTNFSKYVNQADFEVLLFEFEKSFVDIFSFLDFKQPKNDNNIYKTNYDFNYRFDSMGIELIPNSREIKKSDIKKVLLDAIKQYDNIIFN